MTHILLSFGRNFILDRVGRQETPLCKKILVTFSVPIISFRLFIEGKERAGLNPAGDASELCPLFKKLFNCSCNGIYQWFNCHLFGRVGVTGYYFPAERRELPWLSPTTRQSASKKEKLLSLMSMSC